MFSLISILYKVGRKLSSCALIESDDIKSALSTICCALETLYPLDGILFNSSFFIEPNHIKDDKLKKIVACTTYASLYRINIQSLWLTFYFGLNKKHGIGWKAWPSNRSNVWSSKEFLSHILFLLKSADCYFNPIALGQL